MTFLSFWGLPYHVLWNLDEALSSPLPGKQTKGSRVSATHCLTVYATPWSQKRGRHSGSLSFFRQYCGPVFGAGFWPHFWDHERAKRSCSLVLTARISSIWWRQPSFCNASRHGHTHPYNTMRGHGAEAVLNQWKGSTFRGRKKPC